MPHAHLLTRRSFLLLILFALSALGPVGCNSSLGLRTGQLVGANGPFQIDRFTVDSSGPVAIDVSTFAGNVTITADQDIQGARVRIIREGTHGFGRKKEAKASLANISTSVEIVPGELGQKIQVIAATTDPEPLLQRAHVIIELGSLDGLSVQTASGDISVENCEGPIDLATTHGNVRVATNHALIRPINIINHNGSIDLRMRGESSAIFDCETIRGTVKHLVKNGRLIINNGTDDDSLHAVLNDGSNPFTLRTTDGDIRLAVVSNPTAFGMYIFN